MQKPQHPIPLFLDCDPGIDDAVALGYLLCQDDVDIVGIAASGGNVPTRQVVRNTLGWLALAGRTDLPVHPGADLPLAQQASAHTDYAEVTHGDTGSGYAALPAPSVTAQSSTAADAWVAAARAHPGELIGVLVGPATNLALALQIEPSLPRLLKRLFVMGGAFNYRGNTHPTTEWNVTFDPEAASQVFHAFGHADRLPVIGPIEATEAIEITPGRVEALLAEPPASPQSATGAQWRNFLVQLGEALRFYFEFHEADGHGYLAHLHDPYVLAAALGWARHPNGAIPWAETSFAPVDVELTGTLTRGETVADWLGRWERPANAEIIRRIDAADFLDHLTDTLKAGPHHDLTR